MAGPVETFWKEFNSAVDAEWNSQEKRCTRERIAATALAIHAEFPDASLRAVANEAVRVENRYAEEDGRSVTVRNIETGEERTTVFNSREEAAGSFEYLTSEEGREIETGGFEY